MRRVSILCIVVLATVVAVAKGAFLIASTGSRSAPPANAASRAVEGMRTAYVSQTARTDASRRALTFLFGTRKVQAREDEAAASSAEAFMFRDWTTGMASAVTVYLDSHSRASRLLVGLYANRNGRPGQRLATGSLARPRKGAWNRVHVSLTSVQAGKRYWVAVMGEGGQLFFRNSPRGRCGDEGSRGARDTAHSLPATWASEPHWNACSMSAYVSGTAFGLSFGPIAPTGTGPGGATTASGAAPANPSAPVVSGTAVQGGLLTASSGTWAGATPTAYTYQWQVCSNGNCTNIPGATASTYVLQPSDLGDTIDVVVTALTSSGSVSQTSAQTATVTNTGVYTAPAARTFDWDPGLNPVGGIPDASWAQSGATIEPSGDTSGATDTENIQNALNNCPADGVVQLGLGVFYIQAPISMERSYCVLRGSGPGPGNWPTSNGEPVAASGTGGTYLESTGNYAPLVVMGPRYGNNGGGTPTNLTADGERGATSVTVASTAGLAAGGLAVVDQVNGNTTVSTAVSNVDAFTSSAPGVLQVASTANFPTSGTIEVVTSGGVAAITYTGLAGGDEFTGCVFEDGQSGSVSTSASVLDTSLSHWNSKQPENGSGWFEEPNRPLGDVMEIASVSGNTVNFTTPLPITYKVSQSAHLLPLLNVVHDVGVENLYMYGATGGDGGGATHMWNCDHCWVTHIEASDNDEPINLDWSFGDEVTDSYIHDAPGGLHDDTASYGIVLSNYTSNVLIQNNIVMRFDKVDAMRSAGGGNVFGYNFMDDGMDLGGEWSEDTLEGNHMTTPHYELFEGNEAPNADTADTWGNSIYITYFRNYLTGEDLDYPGVQPVRAAGLSQYDGWYSFVGNVLGEPNDSNMVGYEAINGDPSLSGYEWSLCNLNADDNVPDGGLCLSTVLRDGNYDYYSNEVHWHGIGGTGVNNGLTPPTDDILPDSLYLTSKPAFFGTTAWPWVNGSSASDPLPGQLPAEARYAAGTPNTVQ